LRLQFKNLENLVKIIKLTKKNFKNLWSNFKDLSKNTRILKSLNFSSTVIKKICQTLELISISHPLHLFSRVILTFRQNTSYKIWSISCSTSLK
jgi:hypothetical protein